jgi:hypothetical protein
MRPNRLTVPQGISREQARLLGQSTGAAEVPEYPALAPHVQLVGEMQGTGFKERQWLIRRHSQFIQLTELLYRVAEYANGVRTLEEIATEVTEATDWLVSADHIRQLLQTKLMPLGIIAPAAGTTGWTVRQLPSIGHHRHSKSICT